MKFLIIVPLLAFSMIGCTETDRNTECVPTNDTAVGQRNMHKPFINTNAYMRRWFCRSYDADMRQLNSWYEWRPSGAQPNGAQPTPTTP